MTRVFLDSGVFVQAIGVEWCAARAILILGSHRVLELETSEVVMAEVTGALQRKGLPTGTGSEFGRLLRVLRLTVHPKPSVLEVVEGIERFLPLMRHKADIAVLVSALSAKPDWLMSGNLEHFTPAVARATGLRIVSPAQLMTYLGISHTT